MNITNDIIYIGQDDKETTLFESQYMLEAGMCYNSYLINDDKIAIMDTSDQRTFEAWLEDLKNALNGSLTTSWCSIWNQTTQVEWRRCLTSTLKSR